MRRLYVIVLRFYKVVHFIAQGAVRVLVQPQAAQRVLHHVAHDPVRREDLRGGGDILLAKFLLAAVDGVFFLRDVKLVEPSDELHLLVVLVRDRPCRYELINDTFAAQEAGRQEQLRVVVHAPKDAV